MHQRHITTRIHNALEDTRVVLITGPRQAGKTTLVQQLTASDRPFFTLDDPTTTLAARSDPVGFIRELDYAVIDEVQRAPELLLAIKTSVDDDPRPGRFLLTGSADLMSLPLVADSLAGRMEVIQLMPLAQSEIRATSGQFLQTLFTGEIPDHTELTVGSALVDTVLAGGYPEALTRDRWDRRQDWYLNYVDAIVQRDIHDIAHIEQQSQMPKLLSVMAEQTSQLCNYSQLGAPLNMNHNTTQRYVGILERVFLTERLQPWYSSRLKSLIKTPKLHFLDSGLLSSLRDITPESVVRDRRVFGPVLETFVFSELRKLALAFSQRLHFYHYRDKQGNEVDLVLEDRRGRIVGIEIKASATVSAADLKGLRKLEEATGTKFVAGIVLYDHNVTVPFSDTLAAVPLSALWG